MAHSRTGLPRKTLWAGTGFPLSLLHELTCPTWVRASLRGPLIMFQRG